MASKIKVRALYQWNMLSLRKLSADEPLTDNSALYIRVDNGIRMYYVCMAQNGDIMHPGVRADKLCSSGRYRRLTDDEKADFKEVITSVRDTLREGRKF